MPNAVGACSFIGCVVGAGVVDMRPHKLSSVAVGMLGQLNHPVTQRKRSSEATNIGL